MRKQRQLVFGDGRVFRGVSFGDETEAFCELVFNTSMVGYQEILSDPSYTDQAVVLTYPLIGNYGLCPEDFESEKPSIGALIVREYETQPSGGDKRASLEEAMKRWGIPGLAGVDTRALTRIIRKEGSQRVLLCDGQEDRDAALLRLRAYRSSQDAVSRVTTKALQEYPAESERFRVVAIDCGMKRSIGKALQARHCHVIAVPYNMCAKDIEALSPDGIFISNGPGDPEDVPELIETIRVLRGRYAIFGICLGHQILALACGARTYKLKFGHRGGNHPVKDLRTGHIEITAQNHSYAVAGDSLSGTGLSMTHVNLLDGTIEGIACPEEYLFGVQYHPESAPGPEDSQHLFDAFIQTMEEQKRHAKA